MQTVNAARKVLGPVEQRGYFSLMDRMKEKIQQPLRHIKSFTEPDGHNYES